MKSSDPKNTQSPKAPEPILRWNDTGAKVETPYPGGPDRFAHPQSQPKNRRG